MESSLYNLLYKNLYYYNFWWVNDKVFHDPGCRVVENELNSTVLELASNISNAEAE